MSHPIHFYYDQLTDTERDFVDGALAEVRQFQSTMYRDVPLAGDDRNERAADGLAQWVIESRAEVPA